LGKFESSKDPASEGRVVGGGKQGLRERGHSGTVVERGRVVEEARSRKGLSKIAA